MRSLLLRAPHDPQIVDLPVPSPAPDEIVARVHAAGICGSDLELLNGTRPAPYARYPIVPGHEWAGTIEAVGEGVDSVALGDLVVAQGIRHCGVCARCHDGQTNLCTAPYAETGFTHPGAFAPYIAVPARLVHRLPPTASLESAVLLEPAACVAEGLLAVDRAPGLKIAVIGAGTLGLLAVLMLRLDAPERLTVVDTRTGRLDRAATLGASDTVAAAHVTALEGT